MRPRPERLLDYREFPVLFVDDEAENLRVFELAFRREFRVATAQNGEEALRLLHEMPTAVVLSDQRMEGITGVELLARIRDIDPRTVRILVTAYGDADTLRNAINNGSIYRYVPKPWEPEEMRLTLRNAIEVYALEREREELTRELGILNQVSKTLNSRLEIGPLLDLLTETCTEELGYDGATLLILDAERERLAVERCAPAEGEVADRLRTLTIPCAGAEGFMRRIEAGSIQWWTSSEMLELSGSERALATEIAAEEVLVVPIVGSDGVLGALAVDNRRGGRGFTTSDRTLLSGLASQAAISLQNARLVDHLRRFEEGAGGDRFEATRQLVARLAGELETEFDAIRKPLQRSAPEMGAQAGDALAALERAQRTLGVVSGLAREPASPGEAWMLGGLVAEACALLEAEARACGVALELDPGSDPSKVVASGDATRELLVRLVGLALRDARQGSSVRLSLRSVGAGESGGASVAELEITLEGSGFASERIERLVDPFQSGDAESDRDRFDWLLCQQIVAALGGSLAFEAPDSDLGAIRLRLPAEPATG